MSRRGRTKPSGLVAYAVASALALTLFAVLEAVHPYCFLQDDNRDIFLPFYVHDYRAAADGQLALYNFYQSLGKPHFATGQVAALQPVVYISIFLSKAIFGHVFASIDILTLIYLLLGAAGAVALIRLLRYSDAAAVFVATAWVASPFNILTSQSWATYSPVVGLLPWLVLSTLMIYRRRFASGGVLFVIGHLLFFYVGAPQFFLYAGMLEIGIVVWVAVADFRARSIGYEELARVAMAFTGLTAGVVLLTLPLLLPMWNTTMQSAFRGRSAPNPHICSIPVSHFLNGIALPFEQLFNPRDGEWCEHLLPASLTHQGYVATLLLCAWPLVRRRSKDEQGRTTDALFAIGIILLIGAFGGLVQFTSVLPMVNRFRWPFKFFGFANLLLVVCAAPALDALLAGRARALAFLAIAIQFINLIAVDITFPIAGFFEHLDPVPLREPLRNVLASSRTLTLGCRPAAGGLSRGSTVATLGYDYATLWKLHYFGGYDPLVPLQNYQATLRLDYNAVLCVDPHQVPIDYFRRWGIGYYILDAPSAPSYEPSLTQLGMRRIAREPERVVMFDPLAPSLVSGPGCTMRSLGSFGDDLTAVVDCARDSTVTLRFLFNPDFVVRIDGRETQPAPTAEGQIALPVLHGTHLIRVAYEDAAFTAGLRIATATIAAAALAFLLIRLERSRRRRPASPPSARR